MEDKVEKVERKAKEKVKDGMGTNNYGKKRGKRTRRRDWTQRTVDEMIGEEVGKRR